jgi:uncharacterized protein YecE (DUF72 family)
MTNHPAIAENSKAPAIFVGTSGWAYTSWKPDFYPPKLSAKKFLEHYATRLNTVEVNYTFRAFPTAPMLSSWLAATGDNFRFSFKAPQRITHMLRLKNCEQAVTDFIVVLQPVITARRMGVVLFQLPPNFKADIPRLDEFLTFAGRSKQRIAFEFRHDSWFDEEVYVLMRKHNVALCIAESDDLTTPDVRTADFTCLRIRKTTYSDADLYTVSARLQAASQLGEVFAYFKHEDEPTGALRAEAVLKELVRQ